MNVKILSVDKLRLSTFRLGVEFSTGSGIVTRIYELNSSEYPDLQSIKNFLSSEVLKFTKADNIVTILQAVVGQTFNL